MVVITEVKVGVDILISEDMVHSATAHMIIGMITSEDIEMIIIPWVLLILETGSTRFGEII